MEGSFVPAASPPPSLPLSLSAIQPALHTYVEPAGRTIGLFRSPSSLAGQKHALTPSPPSDPPPESVPIPTSPPPPVASKIGRDTPQDWRDWIRQRRIATRRRGTLVTVDDIESAAVAAAALASSSPPL